MCDPRFLGICFTQPAATSGDVIFGFGNFLSALALLVLVYNSTDPLYRFRIAVAPIRLYPLTFAATAIIGYGSLLTDLWFAQRWYAPAWGVSRAEIQAALGFLFLLLALAWTWFAFVRPATFGRMNARRYFEALYVAVVRGSEKDLAAVAGELVRSCKSLVSYAIEEREPAPDLTAPHYGNAEIYATRTLLILGNKKLCRHIVETSPITAIEIMQAASDAKKYRLPLGQFAQQITNASILNVDSILFHEGTSSADLVARWRPFTTAIYGNFELLDGMTGGSALDIDYRVSLTPLQFEAYCRIVLTAFSAYIESGKQHAHSFAIVGALSKIKEVGTWDVYKPNGSEPKYPNDPERRFELACEFVRDAVAILAKQPNFQIGHWHIADHAGGQRTILDRLALVANELLVAASRVTEPADIAWHIQHNTAWNFFSSLNGNGTVWRVFQFKLARLLYREVQRLETMPNFRSAKVLGLLLNVTALGGYLKHRDPSYPIGRAALDWACRNYMRLAEVHPPVAEACLIDRLAFDREGQQLIREFPLGLNLKPSVRRLALRRPASIKEVVDIGSEAKPKRAGRSRPAKPS